MEISHIIVRRGRSSCTSPSRNHLNIDAVGDAVVAGDSREAKRSINVVSILAAVVTSFVVVADREVRRNVGANVGKTAGRAVLSGATNNSRSLPDNLGEVTVVVKVATWVCLAVVRGVCVDLSVVPEVGDDIRNLISSQTGSNVLAVYAVARGRLDGRVVGVDAGGGNLLGNGGELIRVCEVGGRVVGTVNVVGQQNSVRVGRDRGWAGSEARRDRAGHRGGGRSARGVPRNGRSDRGGNRDG